MIKVQNDITRGKDPLAEVLLDEDVKACLLDKEIVLGNHCHPDYIFTMANGLKDPKPNTIAFERIDGPQVKNKHLLKNENVLKLVKMYTYNRDVSNLACTDGRILTRFLNGEKTPPRVLINKEEWNKVTRGVSFLHYKRHDKAEQMASRPFIKCNDVFFAGTTQYGDDAHESGKLISIHRQGCLRKVKGLQRGIKTITGGRQAFNANEYLTKLGESKITVSPWGWGESCYRDYEALMLRTDVIKPRSYPIYSNPDIYTDMVFYCKPDWSDLEDVINKCLETWEDRKEARVEASKRLIELRQPKAIAGILENIIKEAE